MILMAFSNPNTLYRKIRMEYKQSTLSHIYFSHTLTYGRALIHTRISMIIKARDDAS